MSDSSATHAMPVQDAVRGILLMSVAFIFFSMLDTTAKYLGRGYPMSEVIWARYAGHAVVALLFLWPHRRRRPWRSQRPGLQVLRGLLLLCGTGCNFLALRYLQLAETSSIYFATPLLVAALSVPLLGEHIGPRRLGAIIVGFVGVLIVVRPGLGLVHWAVGLSCITALSGASYQILTRKLAGIDGAHVAQLYTGAVGFAVVTPFVPVDWTTPQGIAIPLMLVIGVFGGVGHWLLTVAHAYAPAPILAPFTYTQIIWMPTLGYLVFGDVPAPWTLIGGMVVVASGLYLLHRERVVKHARLG